MDEQEHLKKLLIKNLLKRCRESLHRLELQATQHGGYDFSPLSLQNRIDQKREEIELLEARLSKEPEIEAEESEAPSRRILVKADTIERARKMMTGRVPISVIGGVGVGLQNGLFIIVVIGLVGMLVLGLLGIFGYVVLRQAKRAMVPMPTVVVEKPSETPTRTSTPTQTPTFTPSKAPIRTPPYTSAMPPPTLTLMLAIAVHNLRQEVQTDGSVETTAVSTL